MAFADAFLEDPARICAAASGFGGGIARLRSVCGCVSGMTLIAGIACPATDPADKAARTRNYALVQKLADDFKQAQGSIICRELIGIRASATHESPEPSDRTPQYYRSRGCAGYVASAASILASRLNDLQASGIPDVFASRAVEYTKIGCVNWPESFPYRPEVSFAAGISRDCLYIHYKVKEDVSRAVAAKDNSRVWEDSCVETFISFDDSGYYNIECNCIGKLVFGFGKGRGDRVPAPDTVLGNVGRWSSEGEQPFEEKSIGGWEVALAIPLTAFFRHNLTEEDFRNAKVNVYKCGDLLSKPHYVSLFPIDCPAPDFHRPEFFRPHLQFSQNFLAE